MGGKSSSASNQTTTTETNNASLQDTSGFAAGSVKATNIEVLDGGAIQSAFDFGKENQAQFAQTFESVLGLAESSVSGQKDIIDSISKNKTSEATAGLSKNILPLVFVAAVALIGYKAVK